MIFLTLPDLLVNLLLSGGLSAALIPRLRALPNEEANRFSRQVFWWVVLAFGVAALVLAIMPDTIYKMLAPGMSSAASAVPPLASVALATAVPLTAAAGVTSAILNARKEYFVAGIGTVLFNASIISALYLSQSTSFNSVVALSFGVALGAGVRLATQAASLPKSSLVGSIQSWKLDSTFAKGFFAAVTSTSLGLLVPVAIRALASLGQPGAIASMNYGLKLVELPVGVLITSVSTVALTQLSIYYGSGDMPKASARRDAYVQKAIVNAFAVSAVLFYFAEAIVEMIFGRGAMSRESVVRVASLTQIFLIGLPFIAMAAVSTSDLYAREKHGVVFRATASCLALFPVLALPGIVRQSEILLAGAVVCFQALHAMYLARLGGMLTRRNTWINRSLLAQLLIIACVVIVAAAVDQLLHLPSGFFKAGFALVSAAAAVALPPTIVLSRR